ncbi:MAG: poly(3-hydroxybutyrate) depolymerase, partial [Pseudobdellovibrio sp.]
MFKQLFTLIFGITILCSSQNSYSEEKKSWLREKIKERITKKLQEKQAPEASSDVSSKITKSGNYTFKITHNDLARFYILHVPENYKASNSTALIFALHGGGGDMNIQATEEYYKFISKSDKEGFIVAFPNGSSKFQSGNLATWNAGKCCGEVRDKKIDDVGFIKEIIKNTS